MRGNKTPAASTLGDRLKVYDPAREPIKVEFIESTPLDAPTAPELNQDIFL
jgi:hypothetical protein